MNTSALVAILGTLFILASSGLIFYALRNKGDVRAQLSHGGTIFKLEAKHRSPGKKRKVAARNTSSPG